MNLSPLLPHLQSSTAYHDLLAQCAQSTPLQLNLLNAARPYVLAALQQDIRAPILVLAAKPEQALLLHRQLLVYSASPDGVLYFPEPEGLPYERSSLSLDTRQKRLTVLHALINSVASGQSAPPNLQSSSAQRPAPLIVASARALMQQTLAPTHFRAALHTIHPDETHPLLPLLTRWQQLGYEAVSMVEARGQFSHRGGIVDVWSPAHEFPARLEFFGDEIDSIRQFDLVTQRSKERLSELRIIPASEALPQFGVEAAERLQPILSRAALNDGAARDFADDLEQLRAGKRFRNLEFYLPYLEREPHTLLDYLTSDALIVSDDARQVVVAARAWLDEVAQLRADAVARGDAPERFATAVVAVAEDRGRGTGDGETIMETIAKPQIANPNLQPPISNLQSLTSNLQSLTHRRLDFTFGLSEDTDTRWQEMFSTAPRYGAQLPKAIDDWRERQREHLQIVVVSRQAERIAELAREKNLALTLSETPTQQPISLLQGVLNEGFELTTGVGGQGSGGVTQSVSQPPIPAPTAAASISQLIVISDAELFGYARLETRRPAEKRATPTESFYADLSPGDYVVHIEHGIAKYAGLTRRDFNYGEREYLLLAYAEGDKLFVPIDQADRVARYVGVGEASPRLNRLGTSDWEQAKAKAKRAVDDIAEDLIDLYARRAQIAGHVYSHDNDWQHELENSFPYTETADQLRAIAAIKKDMESPRPMDRLICGDVGYGKTEVALRAAFKAVNDGKQVAVLVPTTVLAEQHLKTFTQRLKPFPVEVEMLSRFRTESQQQKIIARLQEGGIDIIIGTHRLLQDDVQFKDLGLLIIDEEQRFGVKAKEKLKQFRTEIDVLTMTATPIPRTLNMALMGARDMSTIDTPPEERLPIRTYVTQYDEAVIKQAILRELGRGGQVFFVHNRVQGIEQVQARLKRLAPDARITIGHGQMRERELERVMMDFDEGKYDVLVCTSIIESGIDLPNVNTIIINRADQFGLSDLYQLRGRVGRSNKQSYAYLMYSRDKELVDVARKRLQAIFEASELGAGFKIAMRDMEIRGAGEILGARQHGQIAAIGFDLYTRLLAQAIRQKRVIGDRAQDTGDGGRRAGDGGRRASGERKLESAVDLQPSTPDLQSLTPDLHPLTPTLDLPLEAHIPSDYVAQEELRLRLYRRIAELTSVDAVQEFAQELQDRFGPVPQPALNLLYLLRLKVWATRGNLEAIVYDPMNERFIVRPRERVKLLEFRAPREVEKVVSVGRFELTVQRNARDADKGARDWREVLEAVVKRLAD